MTAATLDPVDAGHAPYRRTALAHPGDVGVLLAYRDWLAEYDPEHVAARLDAAALAVVAATADVQCCWCFGAGRELVRGSPFRQCNVCSGAGRRDLSDPARLAWAGVLEATAGEVETECERCKRPEGAVNHVRGHIFVGWGHGWQPCSACGGSGSGRVGDGRKERAEFIRVQVEFAALPEPDQGCPFLDDYGHNPPRWREGRCQCRGCVLTRRERELLAKHGKQWLPDAVHDLNVLVEEDVVYRRGLVAELALPLRTLIDHAGALGAACAGLERVTVSDAVIYPSGGNDTYYVGNLGAFPREYWRGLEGHPTAAAARAALSRAGVRHLKAAGGWA